METQTDSLISTEKAHRIYDLLTQVGAPEHRRDGFVTHATRFPTIRLCFRSKQGRTIFKSNGDQFSLIAHHAIGYRALAKTRKLLHEIYGELSNHRTAT